MSFPLDNGSVGFNRANQTDWESYSAHAESDGPSTVRPEPASAPSSGPSLPYNVQAQRLQAGGAPGPDFDAQVRGTDAKALDLDLAKMARDCYDLGGKGGLPAGWTRMSDADLAHAGIDPGSLDDPSTGFRAAIYQDAKGDHVLAFAGTDPTSGKDILADAEQATGLPARQYQQAVALATQAKTAFGDSLALTGHSLGGGLASVASVATDSAAVTFNAAGVNNNTLRQLVPGADVAALKQEADDGLVRRYAVKGEILTGEQESGAFRGFAPDAIGHKITLNDPNPLPWYAEAPGVNLISDSIHGGQLHLMDSVLGALQKDHPWDGGAGREGVVDKISDTIGKGTDAVVSGVDWAKNQAKDGIQGVTNVVANAADHVPVIGGLLSGAVQGAGLVGRGAVEIGGDLLDGSLGITGHLLQGTDKFVGGAIGATVDGAKKVGGWIVDGAKAAGGAVVGAAQAVGNAVVDGAAAAGSAIAGAAKAAGNAVFDGAKAVGGAVADGAAAAGDAVVDGATAAGDAVVDGATAAGGAVVDGAAAVGGAVVDGATAVGGAVVDGATAAGSAVVDGAEAVGHALNPMNWL